ncbi:MAG: molybdopterin biosynthesis protein MoeY [Spiribacter salinus]|uniref:Molybdopterin biosynthesis protein MoeY n=1 Tax=Spiribacter salinus TaxID=1335746 RepID=A0A540VRH9_9GAMM|nr:MAG: molybdopterin biosynthesis protein MoeY [Spiribacter salinus]
MSEAAPSPDWYALLERARWAPSGDNAQPWRFRILSSHRLTIDVHDTSHEVLYDYRGQATLLAAGALLETLRLAAMASGWNVDTESVHRVGGLLRVTLRAKPWEGEPDSLHAVIESRSTHRRPLSPRRFSVSDREVLEDALPCGYRLLWHETPLERWRMARMLWRNAGIRLTTPEAFTVHRDAIEWGVRESADRIPAAALGMDRLGLALMRSAMKSWRRVDLLNRYFGGTWLPRLQLDLLPALFCGGHFLLLSPQPAACAEDHIAAGEALQRLWLRAAALGVQFQPNYTPIVFHRYVRSGERFTGAHRPWSQARQLADLLDDEFGESVMRHAVFMGRMGYGRPPRARSIRKPLAELLLE